MDSEESFECAKEAFDNAALPVQAVIEAVSQDFAVSSSTTILSCWGDAPHVVVVEELVEPFGVESFVEQRAFGACW